MFAHLPSDVVDRVLTFVPDFKTLSAALRTNKKHLYEVFQTHPKSIVLAIAYGVVGPALPQAIRMIRIFDRTVVNMPANASDFDLPGLIDHSHLLDISLTRTMAERLTEQAASLWELEDLFSLCHKDRTSVSSLLTPTESLRFHRAMWQFWSLTVLEDAEDQEDLEMVKLMKSIPTQELHDMNRVKSFLEELMTWGYCASEGIKDNSDAGVMIAVGPDIVLSSMRNFDIYDFYDWMDRGGLPFDEAFERTWNTRRIKDKDVDEKRDKAILESVNGEKDECARCSAAVGVRLWGASNWWLLRGRYTPSEIRQYLGGNLWRNPIEGPAFDSKLSTYKDDFKHFIEDLMDLNSDTGETWDKTKWYCDQCIVELWRQRVRKWWLQEKIKDGVIMGVDCWYGYNCRTQVHKREHAEKLNHVCEPTRGDAA